MRRTIDRDDIALVLMAADGRVEFRGSPASSKEHGTRAHSPCGVDALQPEVARDEHDRRSQREHDRRRTVVEERLEPW